MIYTTSSSSHFLYCELSSFLRLLSFFCLPLEFFGVWSCWSGVAPCCAVLAWAPGEKRNPPANRIQRHVFAELPIIRPYTPLFSANPNLSFCTGQLKIPLWLLTTCALYVLNRRITS